MKDRFAAQYLDFTLESRVGLVECEAADLRKQVDGLRAELDARKQWGLWRRMRGR